MPLYEVEHIIPLSLREKEQLARSITEIHTQLFTTLSLFVNVRFTDTANHDVYIGGKKRSANRIMAHVRPGGDRSTEHYNSLCAQLTASWARILEDTAGDRELRAIFVLGTIVAGSEAGFALPPAGGDRTWLKENAGEFEKRARAGDGDFGDVLEEMRTRGDLRGLL